MTGGQCGFWKRKEASKESGPKGPGFRLPPEGASMVFPRLRQCAGVMEWWSNGENIYIRVGCRITAMALLFVARALLALLLNQVILNPLHVLT